ncbi:PadR family transcriptional regulator [Rhodovibrionaceae bacterium A322]
MQAKLLCLSVLLQGAASGYEIKKTLEKPPFEHFQDTGFGSIYPALTKLAEEGFVEVMEMAQEKRPDKKVYSLTDAGHAHFMSALMRPPGPDRFRSDFMFLVYHGDYLPPHHLLTLIDQRLMDAQAKLEDLSSCAQNNHNHLKDWLLHHGMSHYDNERRSLIELRKAVLASTEPPPLDAPIPQAAASD